MIAKNTSSLFPAIPPLSPTCFTFVDDDNAIAERGGLTAKACRGRLRRVDRKGIRLAAKKERQERYARLVSFYSENSCCEASPFNDSDVADRLAELLARHEDISNSFVEY